jgi:alpha-1,2-mannosyltransferase
METEEPVAAGGTSAGVAVQAAGDAATVRPGGLAALRDPVALAIAFTTLLAVGLRVYYLSRPGYLLGVTEYDDGPYFGSAVRLVSGVMPYRDFILVQPPGITLLMLPAALLAKVTGTAWGMAVGRMLTALAGVVSVPLMGRLVRHRGVFTTLVACGMVAVFPDSVAAAHTVLVEPWLVLFCLIGAVLMVKDDRLVNGRGLLLGGVAFGFAGVIEAWAVVPVVILLVLCLTDPVPGKSRLSRALPFAGGVAGGFLVPVLPFAVAAPRGFYQSLIVAQVGPRSGATRVPLLSRLTEMTGLSDIRLPVHVNLLLTHFELSSGLVNWTMTAILVALAVGVPAVLNLVTGKPPTALEWFALASTELIVVMFLWPVQFHYHFAAFLAPFLGLAIALPLPRLFALRKRAGEQARPSAGFRLAGLVVVLLVVFAFIQGRTESRLTPVVGPSAIAQAKRIIPPGSCVVSDSAALLLLADRFVSDEPGCGVIDDGLGTDLALSHGLTPATGAAYVPAVTKLWSSAFEHAQFVWFTSHSWRRVAWSTADLAYFQHDFKPALSDSYGDILYRRDHGQPS